MNTQRSRRTRILTVMGTALAASLLASVGVAVADEEPDQGSLAPDPTSPIDPSSTGGRSYDVTITSDDSGEAIAFTVFEPATIDAAGTHPLVLHGHGFGGMRSRTVTGPAPVTEGSSPGSVLGDVQHLVNDDFWVVSFDQRGHWDSGGSVRFMDPDHEGVDLVQLVDWLEANLHHLAYRDGNLVLGSTGGSYGGGYQYSLLAVDPDERLDAIVPQITWYDLNQSFAPNGVLQSTYVLALMGPAAVGTQGRLDPFVLEQMLAAGATNNVSPELEKFLGYHSPRYWCDGVTYDGLTDEGLPYREATPLPKVDALLVHGMHDVIFTLNEELDAYDCLARQGGDVRLTSYQFGHTWPNGANLASPPAIGPDCSVANLCADAFDGIPQSGPGVIDAGFACGPTKIPQAELTWFRAKLRQDPAAIAELDNGNDTCISLDTQGDAVSLDGVTTPDSRFDIPAGTVTFNALQPVPTALPLTRIDESTVLAGVPTATITIDPVLPDPGVAIPELGIDDPVVFVSIARSRGALPDLCRNGLAGIGGLTAACSLTDSLSGVALPADLEVIDSQLTPIRGLGTHTIELNGLAERLGAGEQLHLLVSTYSHQFGFTGSRTPFVPAVTVSGTIDLPLLGDLPRL